MKKDDSMDLTEKKYIKQSTLLVGSSILKGVKTNELKPNATVRSFSGATTVTLKDKLTTIILRIVKPSSYTLVVMMLTMVKTWILSATITSHC